MAYTPTNQAVGGSLIAAERRSDPREESSFLLLYVLVIDYLQILADRVLKLPRELSRPVIIGVNGGPGSGKSTLSLLLVEWLIRERGVSAAWLSLDDLYYSKAKRLQLAQSTHP